MTTSGTYGFAPSTGELILQAFRRIGIARVAVTAEQMLDARMELNLLGAEWANNGPNLWAVDFQGPFTLAAGQATLTLDAATVDVLDLYVTIGGADRSLWPMSRSDYAEQARKLQTGQPTSFWFDRLTIPTITFWPVPATACTVSFFRSRQTQDAVTAGGATPDTPFRFSDALVWGLAERLAIIYQMKDMLPIIGLKAQSSLAAARSEDTEDAATTMSPVLSSYFR